jgi:cell division protein FtsN
MPKDYKDAPSSRGGDSRLSHPLLLGMIIGLLLGIVISLAVALWLNRLANPFVDKGKAPDITSKMAPAQPPPPQSAAKAADDAAKAAKGTDTKAATKAPERPRFEFYNILPGDRDNEKPAVKSTVAPPPTPAPPPPKPGSSPSSPKPHSGEVYWLQAGAFTDEKEADNLKAKIAFTGLEASVRSVDIAEKGKLYRVRLGPYQSLEDANRIKAALSQNGVGAAIIKVNEEPKNP